MRRTILACVLLIVMTGLPLSSEEQAGSADVRLLAEEVDVLQIVSDMKLDEKQLAFVAGKAESSKKRREEFARREEAILNEIKEPLRQIRDALVAGKEVPASADSMASAKQKELQKIRAEAWQEFQSAVLSCIQLLDEGQVRVIARTPEAMTRARQMVQQIRSASNDEWPKVLAELTSELVKIRKLDKEIEWQAEEERILDLTGDEREQAAADLEKRKESDIAQMKAEISQLLSSIRMADQRVLSIGVNKLATALRSKADIQAQLFGMMSRVLDSPASESALKARLDHLKAAATKKD